MEDEEEPRTLAKILRFLRLFAVAIALFVGGMAALLLGVADTVQGRVVAGMYLALATLPFIWNDSRLRAIAVGVSAATLVIALLERVRSPPTEAPFQSVYADGSNAAPWLLSPSTMVPEVDQFLLGSTLIPVLDPFMDAEQANRVRRTLRGLYRPLHADLAYRRTPSALGQCYWDILFEPPRGHHFEHVPESDSPVPVVLFLHGSLGNFKGYYGVLAPLAEEDGVAIVGPSFGVGNWHNGGLAAIEHTVAAIEADPRLDAERIVLVGLSNGGRGVSIALEAFPERFVAAAYLSPVLGRLAVNRLGDTGPILVVTGTEDRRVQERFIRLSVSRLEETGHQVRAVYVPGQDHFLLFDAPDAVMDPLRAFVSEHVGGETHP